MLLDHLESSSVSTCDRFCSRETHVNTCVKMRPYADLPGQPSIAAGLHSESYSYREGRGKVADADAALSAERQNDIDNPLSTGLRILVDYSVKNLCANADDVSSV